MLEQVRTFDQFTWQKKSVGNAQSQEVYFSKISLFSGVPYYAVFETYIDKKQNKLNSKIRSIGNLSNIKMYTGLL